MRKLLFLMAFAFLSFCLFTCKKNNTNTPQALIAGKWTLQNASYTMYRNDTLLDNENYTNCTCSIQFNNNGSFSDFYNVTGSFGADTTSGNYRIVGKTITFSITSDRGHWHGLIIPTPVAFFVGGELDAYNLATNSDQITQLTTSNLSVHAVVTSTPSESGVYKAIIDEKYTR